MQSNTTASGSATIYIPPSTDGDIQLVSDVSYPEETIPPDQATDNVSIEQDSDSEPSNGEPDNKSPAQTAPRRSARSTKGTPPMHYGKVYIYIAQSFQNCQHPQDINKVCMFPVTNGIEHCCVV